jgi:hypothetical protein
VVRTPENTNFLQEAERRLLDALTHNTPKHRLLPAKDRTVVFFSEVWLNVEPATLRDQDRHAPLSPFMPESTFGPTLSRQIFLEGQTLLQSCVSPSLVHATCPHWLLQQSPPTSAQPRTEKEGQDGQRQVTLWRVCGKCRGGRWKYREREHERKEQAKKMKGRREGT